MGHFLNLTCDMGTPSQEPHSYKLYLALLLLLGAGRGRFKYAEPLILFSNNCVIKQLVFINNAVIALFLVKCYCHRHYSGNIFVLCRNIIPVLILFMQTLSVQSLLDCFECIQNDITRNRITPEMPLFLLFLLFF